MRLRNLLLCGAAALAWMLLMQAPAAVMYAWLAPKNAAVRLYGLEGTLSEGRLAALGFNGRPLVSDLHWRLQPWWLPLLRCAFHVDGGGEQLSLSGRVDLRPAGLDLRNAQASGGVKKLLGGAGLAYVPVDGFVKLDLQSLALRQGFPHSAEGSVEVHSLAWTLAKEPLALGDFKATLTTDNDTIVGRIEPLSGPLDVSGEVRLQPDRSYEYNLQLKAKPQADPILQNMLQSLGRPDVQGYYHLRNRGVLAGGAAPGPGITPVMPPGAPPLSPNPPPGDAGPQ